MTSASKRQNTEAHIRDVVHIRGKKQRNITKAQRLIETTNNGTSPKKHNATSRQNTMEYARDFSPSTILLSLLWPYVKARSPIAKGVD